MAGLRSETRVAGRALVKEPTRIGGHRLGGALPALGASDGGLQDRLASGRRAVGLRGRAAVAGTGAKAIPDGGGEQTAQAGVKRSLRKIAVERPSESRDTGDADGERPRAAMLAETQRQAHEGEDGETLEGVENETLEPAKRAKTDGGTRGGKERETTRSRDGSEESSDGADTVKDAEEAFHGGKIVDDARLFQWALDVA